MDLLIYIAFSAVYIMMIHFAVAIRGQFNLFAMIAYFVIAGFIGGAMGAYEVGFVGAVILSFVLW